MSNGAIQALNSVALEVSYDEKRCVAIARALAQTPRLLLLDGR